jgi:anti-sigma regulatory factor (Ser/Thr protein kinase)
MTRLAEFTVPSEQGNERLVLNRVADLAAGQGLAAQRLERLKTAVAEATMNAIEHGNHNRPELLVHVAVDLDGQAIVVSVTDLGGGVDGGGTDGGGTDGGGTDGGGTDGVRPAAEPNLDLKLAGEQSPRGWGLFLIRNMVDAMDETTQGARHTVRLTMRTTEGATT